MAVIRIFRRLQDLQDVDQNALPDGGVPQYDTNVSSFVVETIAAGGGFSLGASNLGNTLGDTGVTGSRVVLAGIGNLTLSQATDANGGTISISGGTAGAGFSAGVSGGNTAGATGATGTRLVFAGGNSITLSQATDVNGGTITVSGATTSQSVQTQNLHNVTLSGNTAGAMAQISSGTLTLAGGNRVTLSQNGNAITISGADQSVQPETQTFIGGISASNTLYTSGSVRFTGSNIVTVRSGTGQLVVIDASTSQSVQTQNMVALTLSGNTAGAQALMSSGTVTIAGGNNITVSQNGNGFTISGPNVGGAQTGISGIVASDATYTSGTVTFTGSGNITVLSGTGQRVIISGSQSVQPETQTFIAGIAASDTTYTSGTVRITGVGGGVTVNSNTGQRVDISVAAPVAQTGTQFSAGISNLGNTAGDTGTVAGRVVLVGSNNITLSGSTNGASATVSFLGGAGGSDTDVTSINQAGHGLSVGDWARLDGTSYVKAQADSVTNAEVVGVVSAVADVDNFTLITGGLVTGLSGLTAGAVHFLDPDTPGAITDTEPTADGDISKPVLIARSTTSGYVFNMRGAVIDTAPLTAFLGGVSNVGNTAGDTGITGSRLVLAGTNGITLSQSTNASGGTVSISGVTQSVESQSFGMSNIGNTSGTTGIASGGQVRFLLAGGNNVTLSQSLNGASGTITISAASQTAESQSIGMSNLGNTSGTTGIASGAQVRMLFAGGNNVTLSQSLNGASGTLTISAASQTVQTQGILSAGVSTGGNTQGNTQVSTGSRLVLVGTNNITLSQGTAAGATTISISGAPSFSAGVSTGGNTAGATGITGTNLVWVGSNNITLSQTTGANGGTVSIIGPSPGAAQYSIGVSNLGNTAGSTGVTGTRIVFVGTNVMSLSQSTDATGATISVDAPATSSLVGTSGISISTNGSTISIMQTSNGPGWLESWFPHSVAPHTSGNQGQGTLHMQPMPLPNDVRMDRVLVPTWISNASNSSNSISVSQYVGFYTRNVSTLSLVTSQSTATNFSGSGTVGSYSLYGGRRWQSMGLTTTLSSGDWWIGIVIRSTTGGGAGHTVGQELMTQFSNATFSGWSGLLGAATAASMQYMKGLGTFTATTNGLPSAVPFASLTGTGTLVMNMPIYALVSGTV